MWVLYGRGLKVVREGVLGAGIAEKERMGRMGKMGRRVRSIGDGRVRMRKLDGR